MKIVVILPVIFLLLPVCILSQHADDKRCRCVCPSPDAVLNGGTNSKPQLFIAAVPPNQCTCDSVVLPTIKLPELEQVFCLRCECKYESRSPPLIKFVVIMLVVIISFLTGYMVFLTWLRKFLARRKRKFYVENGAREAQNLIHEEDSED